MQENNQNSPATVPHSSAPFGKVPNDAENFGRIPNTSESFRNVPKASERKESHTLTVREVARLFEDAGVARTERSITNWCQPTKSGIARLDAYFDPNERKYFITPQSTEQAIQEEISRSTKGSTHSEPSGNLPKNSETVESDDRPVRAAKEGREDLKSLDKEMMDLRILNGGKDFVIEQLRKEREGLINRVVDFSRQVGQLETQVRQLSAPRNDSEGRLPASTEV